MCIVPPTLFYGKTAVDLLFVVNASVSIYVYFFFKNKCVITCLPNNAEEAADTLNALIPRLKHEYGKEVLKCFHPDAVMDSATTKWDPVMRVATSPEDEALLRDEESDDEEDEKDICLTPMDQ